MSTLGSLEWHEGLQWDDEHELYFLGEHQPPIPKLPTKNPEIETELYFLGEHQPPIPKLPTKNPEIETATLTFPRGFANRNAYLGALIEIAREVALSHCWSEANITYVFVFHSHPDSISNQTGRQALMAIEARHPRHHHEGHASRCEPTDGHHPGRSPHHD
jgi:hypothetical protein